MIELTETQFQAGGCPVCRHKLDAVGGVNGKRPQPGDLSLCAYCGSPLRFGADLTLMALTEAEKGALPATTQEQIALFQEQIRAYWKNPPRTH